MEYPCKECIVSACCDHYCYKVFEFINYLIDEHSKYKYFPGLEDIPTEVIKYTKQLIKSKRKYQSVGYLTYSEETRLSKNGGLQYHIIDSER